ncbi:MAG: DMT family transporter [bacterium]|nr:MAG: DMT family transporter [bacterium]
MARRRDDISGVLIMVVAVLILSPDALLISLVAVDPWTVVFWRGLLTAATMTVGLLFAHGRDTVSQIHHVGWPGVLAGFLFGSSTLSFVLSVRLTAAANTLVIISAMPLFAALFTRLFLKEKVPVHTWIAVTVGFAGIAIVFSGSLAGLSALGDLLAMVTACFMAGNFVIIRRYRKVNMIPAVILSGILTTAAMAPFAAPLSVTGPDVLFLAVMGTIVLPIPLSFMTIAPKLIPAAEVSLIMLLETFLGPLWVWFGLGQVPAVETFLGGGVLVLTLAWHSMVRLGDRPGRPIPDV